MKDIATLAALKSFEELNEKEQAWVLQEMTADAYSQLHRVLCNARSLEANVAPPPALALRLQEHMALKNKSAAPEQYSTRLLNLKVPAWQAAAAVLLILIIGQTIKITDNQTVTPITVVQTIVKTDTIVLEKIQWKERIVLREPPAIVNAAQTDTPGIPQPEATVSIPFENNTVREVAWETTVQGSPISEQPELLQFFTQPANGGR